MVRPHPAKCCTYQLLKSPILVDSQVTFTRLKWLDFSSQKRCVGASLNPSGLSLSWQSLHIPQLNQVSTNIQLLSGSQNLRYHTPTFSSDTVVTLNGPGVCWWHEPRLLAFFSGHLQWDSRGWSSRRVPWGNKETVGGRLSFSCVMWFLCIEKGG